LGQDEEFTGAWVDVRRVEAAGVHEADSGRDTGADDGGEIGAVRKVDLTAGAGLDAGVRGGVEVKLEMCRVHLREEGVSLNFGCRELDAVDEILRDG
jgi:hypothetical protein